MFHKSKPDHAFFDVLLLQNQKAALTDNQERRCKIIAEMLLVTNSKEAQPG